MTSPDPTSLTGKNFALRGRVDHAVVGAGAAGIAAARAAAARGESVLLIDEHPLDPGLFGMDVPYLFGGRVDASVGTQARMEERVVAARPGLEQAIEEGVEVALGVAVWGGFARGPSSAATRVPLLGLADATESWLLGCGKVTIAAGARDVPIPIPGWTLPGVMGAQGFWAALRLYGAFSGRRIVVVGGGALAQGVVAQARAVGIEVAGQVEAPVPLRVLGGLEVEGLAVREAGGWREIACDTVVMAVDTVPMVELPELLGASLAWNATRGGFAPVLPGPSFLTVVGDAAGTAPAARAAWLDVALADPDALVCACEEVTAGDLRALRPPRYLEALGPDEGLRAIHGENQDLVKRLTRAGMGACQGRRCRESVHAILSEAGTVPPATHRPPVRPLPLAVLAALEEDPDILRNWTGWFGIAAQWLPHWEEVPENAEFVGQWLGRGASDK